jgi:pimeloyl-ACP methyl ester carboxylesterase
MSEKSVEIGGARLVFHRRAPLTGGPVEPVVLLHPWFGSWPFWQRTVEALPEFETLSVDLYSLGASDDWQRFAGPQGLARAVGAMLDALRIERCIVVGNSMGGIAAQALAATRGDQISKLVLVGTGARTVGVKPEFRRAARPVDRRRSRPRAHRGAGRSLARATSGPTDVRHVRERGDGRQQGLHGRRAEQRL